jgi:triphosphatase
MATSQSVAKYGEHVRLKANMSVAAVLAGTLATCTRHIRANISRSKRGQDPECLHQLRVGVRRLRAALSVYRDVMPSGRRRAVGRAFRRFEHSLGPARDWDVLVGKFDQAEYIPGKRRQDFSGLIELAKARRSEAHDRLAKALKPTEITKLLRAAQQFAVRRGAGPTLRMPIRKFAVQVLESRDRKARRLGRHVRSLGTTKLHRLRICVKKLRYASEFFEKLWPQATTEPYMELLKQLQDELGEMQDAVSAERLITDVRKDHRKDFGHAARLAKNRIKTSRQHARHKINHHWRNFKVARRFWR